jgi:threonine dehydratase
MTSSQTFGLVELDAIRAAAIRIEHTVRHTPLVDVSQALPPGCPAFKLKCENLQPMGAFKLRGAFNMVAQLSASERRQGVITYSSGNHGQALAFAARVLGSPAVVVMPTTAPRVKIEGVRRLGAEVVLEGTVSSERKRRAEAEAAARGLTMVPPFDHPWIVAGQGTVGLEILEDVPEVESIFVPIGGGGLAAGVAAAVKALRPAVRVVGVEPAGAPKMTKSMEAGRVVTLDRVQSIADGLIPVAPSQLTFDHVRTLVDEIVTVTDDRITAALRWIFREARQVAEPSGAAAVAAVLEQIDAGRRDRGPVVAVLSGGNAEPQVFADILTGGPRSEFVVRQPPL